MGAPDTFYARQYGDMVMLLSQQQESRLRPRVRVKTGVRGEYTFMDQVNSVEAKDITGRFQKTEITDQEHSRRRIALIGSFVNPALDPNDDVKMITDPTSTYVRNGAAAMGRRIDNHIITQALGTSQTGKEGSTAITLPAAQKVAAAGVGMTLVKWLSAKQLLDTKEIPFNDRTLAITSKQAQDLLGVNQIQSADFNTIRTLVMGQLETFLGFTVAQTELITKDGSGNRQVIAFQRDAVGLAVGQDVISRIDERADLNYTKQVYFRMAMGSSRLDENGVVEIACVET